MNCDDRWQESWDKMEEAERRQRDIGEPFERHLPTCAACHEVMEISQKPWLRVRGYNFHSTGSCKEKAKELMRHDEMEERDGLSTR